MAAASPPGRRATREPSAWWAWASAPGCSAGPSISLARRGKGRRSSFGCRSGEPVLPPRAMRILLVDDHPVVRQGIRLLVTDRWADATVGEADSASAALEQIQQHPWDVIVLDISMAGE